MLHKILTALDTNTTKEAYAVIANLIDWSSAFDRQSANLAIDSFIQNGVRASLIPVLVNYFQNRKMYVKWKEKLSSVRDLPGGGPQGCSLGLLSYLSQSSDSASFVDSDLRFKYIDDLTILEIVNLISVGVSSYNFYLHVASDIGTDMSYISSENLQSSNYLQAISDWTDSKMMKLNDEKSNYMIFNMTKKYQFATRLHLNETLLDILDDTKLLGIIISSDLTWHKNTRMLVKKGYQRTIILQKLFEFAVPQQDLITIYKLFIRSILEQSCVVWSSSITQEEQNNLERVQKVSLRIILKENYIDYTSALKRTNLETLINRREKICLNFAKSCIKNEKTKSMFPLNEVEHIMETRDRQKYFVQPARTDRLAKSSLPYLQRLLNKHLAEKRDGEEEDENCLPSICRLYDQ